MSLDKKTLSRLFTIRSKKTLYQLKQYQPLRSYLIKNRTFITNSKWEKQTAIIIGWLYKAIPDYHRQDDLSKEITKVAEIDPANFTLTPSRSTITASDGKRVIYNSLKIESTKTTAKEVQEVTTGALLTKMNSFTIMEWM